MYPPHHPSSGLGQLESQIRELRSDLNNKANYHQIDTLNSRLDSLEHSMREIRTEITDIWDRLSEFQQGETVQNVW